MIKHLYKHPMAIEVAAENVWEKIVNKFGESAGADWSKLTEKRKERIKKLVRKSFKKAEVVARTRPPR